MALMIARVELRGTPTWQNYDKLHTAMRARGFVQTITGTNGTFNLPQAVYSSTSYGSAHDAATAANAAATSVGTAVAVIASGSDWQSYGLTKA